jgi:hypothetical protein
MYSDRPGDRLLKINKLKICALIVSTLIAGSAGAFAQDIFAEKGMVIYDGQPIANQSANKIGGWGSGTCKESSKFSYAGSQSLEITAGSLYSGGRIDFGTPIDLTNAFKTADACLHIVLKPDATQAASVMTDWGGNVTGVFATSSALSSSMPVKRVRAVLCFDGGQAMEQQVDVAAYNSLDIGWVIISIPFAAMEKKLSLDKYTLKRLVICGDGADPFYVGEIYTSTDKSPLSADAGEGKDVSRNDNINFVGSGSGGSSALKYSWDFDSRDGIQEEAVGNNVWHLFREAGDYKVTLTVLDVFGLKKPATSTASVRVNE